MTRARGQSSRATIDREFPFQVLVPESRVGGANMPLVELALANIGAKNTPTFSVFEKDEWHRIFCFADPAHANGFAGAFGGELIDPKRKSSAHWNVLKPK